MQRIVLNDGYSIPAVGLGTFLMSPADAEAAALSAFSLGYRLIDTANAYRNEKAVGRAMKKSGLSRDEIFLETKLWPTVYEKDDAIEDTLRRLDTDYIDLLLLHQPAGNYIHAYRIMEKAVKEGRVRSIGVSNFEGEPLEEILRICEIRPAVIQVEAHPYYPQNELKERLKEVGTKLQAWYPLGHGDKSLQEEEIFKRLAEKYHKSTVQIILRWHVQSENIVIPGSRNPEHIKDNADLFDFELTEEEMNDVSMIKSNRRYYIPNPEQTASYATRPIDLEDQE